MCGHYACFGKETFGYESLFLTDPPPITDYNIPPSRNILTIRTSPEFGKPDYAMLRWGLVPFLSKTPKTKYLLNNARAEGIEKKPSFRGPIKHRRRIIPALGFYEWLRKRSQKTPYFVCRTDGGYLAMGGIWDHWQSDDDQEVESCSIITTETNKLMMGIHDRMPVILDNKDLVTRLDVDAEMDRVLSMLKPCPDSWIEAQSVSIRVNNVKNNGPECVARFSEK